MKHRLFNLATILSLVLCLACVGMWVRGGFYFEEGYCLPRPGTGTAVIGSCDSVLYLAVETGVPTNSGATVGYWFAVPTRGWQAPAWRLPLFRWRSVNASAGGVRTDLQLPYWLLTLTTGVLPVLWFWQRREKRLNRRGFEVLPAPAAKTEP